MSEDRLNSFPGIRCYHAILVIALAAATAAGAAAQQVSLSLTDGSASPGGPATLDLSMTTAGGAQPASIQWDITWSAGDISAVTVDPGPALSAAGKTLSCNATSSTTKRCLAFGVNATAIADGVLGHVNVTVASAATGSSTVISLANAMTSDAAGAYIPTSATGGTVSISQSSTLLTQIGSLSCNPPAFQTPGSTSCTVTLTQAAPSGGFAVSVSGNSADLTVPSSVTVPSGSTSASFTASAGTISSDSTVAVTASANGVSKTFQLTLQASSGDTSTSLKSLTCDTYEIPSGSSLQCTVAVKKPASGDGFQVALSSTDSLLAVPSGVTVPAGAKSVSFSAVAGSASTLRVVVLTAEAGGVSQSVNVAVLAEASLSGVSCAPDSLTSGQSATCTVSMTSGTTSSKTVSLQAGDPLLTVPPSVTIASGENSVAFTAVAGTVDSSKTVAIAATVDGVSKTTSITLLTASPASNNLSCSPDTIMGVGSSVCTIKISQPAPSGGHEVDLSTKGQLTAPHSVLIAAGSKTADFSVQSGAVRKRTQVELTARLNLGSGPSDTLGVTLTLVPVQVSSLTCQTDRLTGGDQTSCTVSLSTTASSQNVQLAVSTDSSTTIVPGTIRIRPHHDRASFQVITNRVTAGETASISVDGEDNPIQKQISILPDSRPNLSVESAYTVAANTNLHFVASATDPQGLSVNLELLNPPQRASFNLAANAGAFDWTPTADQVGLYYLQLRAVNQLQESREQTVVIEVEGGRPTITSALDAASFSSGSVCSPGSLATLFGAGLKDGAPKAADQVPFPREMDGTSVLVNDSEVPILFASSSQINFQCPDSKPGTSLKIRVRTAKGTSDALDSSMTAANPGIFILSPFGATQAAALLAGTDLRLMPRNGLVPSEPAEVGDVISLYVMGLGEVDLPVPIGEPASVDHLSWTLSEVNVSFEGIPGEIIFAGYAPGFVGLYQVNVRVPAGVSVGDAVPLWLEVTQPGGKVVKSKTATIAIED